MPKKIIVVLVVIAMAFVATYIWEANNRAYGAAETFVYNFPYSKNYFGLIRHVSLAGLGSEKEDGNEGTASIVLGVNGAKRHGRVAISLVERDGVWRVVSASVDRRPVFGISGVDCRCS